jgi:hypothetical protein
VKFLTLFIWVLILSFYAHCSIAAIPYEQLYEKTIELTGFDGVDSSALPKIKVVDAKEISELMCAGNLICNVDAAYYNKVILIKEGMDEGILSDSILVHEFTHHLQWLQFNERLIPFLIKKSLYVPLSCEEKRAWEYHAYTIQMQYVKDPIRFIRSSQIYRQLQQRISFVLSYRCLKR